MEEIFDGVAFVVGIDDVLGNHFFVSLMLVSTPADVDGIMSAARLAAYSRLSTTTGLLPTAFSKMYKRIALLGSTEHHVDPTPVAEAILACNDTYSRVSLASRAKIASWRHCATCNLLVPGFGTKAKALLSRTLNLFDCYTMAAVGLPQVVTLRLVVRKKLCDWTKAIIRRLFDNQMAILEKNTLQRFQGALLWKMDGDLVTMGNSVNWTLSYNPLNALHAW